MAYRSCDECGSNYWFETLSSKYCSKQCGTKVQNRNAKARKQAWYLNKMGRTELIERTSKERWIHPKFGYVLIKVDGKLVYEHRVLAEKALGKPLPKGAVVHHMGAPDDNHGFCKLVICPDQEYHSLLHRRMGHANNQYG